MTDGAGSQSPGEAKDAESRRRSGAAHYHGRSGEVGASVI